MHGNERRKQARELLRQEKCMRKLCSGDAALSEIIDEFEKLCRVPIKDDMLLFETGTFGFTGKPLFHFSLARQIPDMEDEFLQLQVEALYEPTEENKAFAAAVWNEDIDGDFFEYVRGSKAFEYAKNEKIIKTYVSVNET